MALLDVVNMSVDLPTPQGTLHAVQNVSFSLKETEIMCIVGESGCGKSLTALAIMGLLPPNARRTSDRLVFNNIDLAAIGPARMHDLRGDQISMIFQDPMTALNPVFTIGYQLMDVYRQHRGGTPAEARKRALYLLDRVGVSSPDLRMKQYPHQLSGGLRQRVMIAMALLCGPRLIVADEPTTALDASVQLEFLDLIDELRREFGLAIVFITHDLGVVARFQAHLMVMYSGQVVEAGRVADVLKMPRHPYTAGLLASVPRRSTPPQTRLTSINGVVEAPIGPQIGCAFRRRCETSESICSEDVPIRHIDGGTRVKCVKYADHG